MTAPSIQVLQLTRQQRQRLSSASASAFHGENAWVVGNPTMPEVSLKIGAQPTQLAA